MDSRKAAETMVKKPFYACVGLSDIALSRASSLPSVVKALPQEARARVKTLQERAGSVRSAADIYAEQANHAFAHFAQRGEQVLSRVRRQPEVRPTESAFDRVADEAADEPQVDGAVGAAEEGPTAVVRDTARRSTTRKSTTRKEG